MPNYYTQLSVVVPMSQEIAEEVIAMLQVAPQWDDGGRGGGPLGNVFTDGYIGFDYKLDDEGLALFHEESAQPEHVADLVTYLVSAGLLHLNKPLIIEWANICDRPVVDAFGGGVVVVFPNGEQHWMNTSDWGWEKARQWQPNNG